MKRLVMYSLMYWICFGISRTSMHVFAAIGLILSAIGLYFAVYQERKNLVDIEGLFSLAWIGGQGLACFQLSSLQTDWSLITWLSFYFAYVGFQVGFHIKKQTGVSCRESFCIRQERMLMCVIGLAVISLVSFCIEVVIVGYIPMFVDFAHAYSYFHVSGIHYFTVSCALIPALSVICLKVLEINRKKVLILFGCNIVTLGICFLSVSRFQLVFGVGLAVVEYFLCFKKINQKVLILAGVFVVLGYGVLSVFRNHDVSYLNEIFEMKYKTIPIWFTQPYMYIVNNYENFNCLVEGIPSFTYGLQSLFPLFALTGLKFLFPQLVEFPDYVTKPELNTYTMFYDAYYDGGVVGVLLLSVVLGCVARWLTVEIEKLRLSGGNPIVYFLYAQIAVYCCLSFFTTWFSLPTTWFWFVITFMMYRYVGNQRRHIRLGDS